MRGVTLNPPNVFGKLPLGLIPVFSYKRSFPEVFVPALGDGGSTVTESDRVVLDFAPDILSESKVVKFHWNDSPLLSTVSQQSPQTPLFGYGYWVA